VVLQRNKLSGSLLEVDWNALQATISAGHKPGLPSPLKLRLTEVDPEVFYFLEELLISSC
jgi:hypothetical protein